MAQGHHGARPDVGRDAGGRSERHGDASMPYSIGNADVVPSAPECAHAQHEPGGSDHLGGCWPGPSNTGVPDGVGLQPYTGACTVTVDEMVIDGRPSTAI